MVSTRAFRFGAATLFTMMMFSLASSRAQIPAMGGMTMGSMPDMHPIPPPEQLPMPLRMTGLGNAHITVTATPEAQAWFDQGLNLLHDFWDYESAKAFEQAVRVDPRCAMCFWGLFEAEGFRGGPTETYKTAALNAAVKLKGHASKSERLYIEASQADYSPGLDKENKAGQARAIALLRKLVAREPHDPEARIFLATSLSDGYDEKGEPKPGTAEEITLLTAVLQDTPNDSAANHYWIHAIEPGNHPERAIPSAALLASLAPASGHMVHMPGHIYYRVGDYANAEHWFAASTAADERYMHDQHISPDDDWNYIHNMMYGIANLIEEGKLADANALSDRLANARGQLSTTLYIWSSRDQMARISNRLPVALRLADWTAVLHLLDAQALPEKENTANLRFLAAELHDYASGTLALDHADMPAAEQASAAMDAGLWRLHVTPDEPAKDTKDKAVTTPAPMPSMPIMPDAAGGPVVKEMSIASLELRAGVLVGHKKLDEARKLYEQARKAEKDLGYREPPAYIRPVAETEGTELARAGDYKDATAAWQAALAERPHSGFALYGLAHTEELAGNKAEARRDYAAFLQSWKSADPALPQLSNARQATATLSASR